MSQRASGYIYPEIVIDSVNMSLHDRAMVEKDYVRLSDSLICSLQNLKAAGAEIAAITANTEHIVWDMIYPRLPIPVISIVDVTINEILAVWFILIWKMELLFLTINKN